MCIKAVSATCVQVGQSDLPGELSIVAPPCKAVPLGSPVQLNFTVTNAGPGLSPGLTVVSFIFTEAAAFQGITVTDPTGDLGEC